MDNYIVIPRYQFTSFYKYGSIIVRSLDLVSAELDESSLIDELQKKLINLPYFEYEDEYIILKICVENFGKEEILLLIDNVLEFIALNIQAKQSIESKIDPRIQIVTTHWAEEVLKKVEENYSRAFVEKGINALWKIAGFNENWRDEPFYSDELFNNLVVGIAERSFVKSRDKVQNSLITQAIVYDRTEFFPDGPDGYLFDICEILCNHLESGFQFKQTELYQWLLDKYQPEQANCWRTYSKDTSFEKLTNFKQSLSSKLPSDKIRWENSIAWYLSQKNNFQKKGQFDAIKFKFELNDGLKDFLIERKAAVLMLGAFFGYKYLYDALYDVLELPFFKKKPKFENPQPQKEVTPFKPITVTQKPGKKAAKPKFTITKGKDKNSNIIDANKGEQELTFNFENSNHIKVEVIESFDKSEPVFEVVKVLPVEEDKIYLGLSEEKKAVILGFILEFPTLKNYSKWIIACYEQCVLEGDESKELFIKKLNHEHFNKPKKFGKKEIDTAVKLFVKRNWIK